MVKVERIKDVRFYDKINKMELNSKEKILVALDDSIECPMCNEIHYVQEVIGESNIPTLRTFNCMETKTTIFLIENKKGVTLFWSKGSDDDEKFR